MNALSPNERSALFESGGNCGYRAGDWLDQNLPEGVVFSDAASTFAHALYGRKGITALYLPNMVRLPDSLCWECSHLETIHIPSCTAIGPNVFRGIAARTLVLPSVTATGNSSFFLCTKLSVIDFASRPNARPALAGLSTFQYCSALETLVLRSDIAWQLWDTASFTGTPFASGNGGGTIYVPSALIGSYRADEKWSTILGYGNGAQNQILPIEGSIYETQYADGTQIGGNAL